uniref:DUF1115 domain-containing protein n=1 Tax=Ascaris lumbricoides TaxID=6252 RepID=A0A0M3HYS9_ASCLU
MNEVFLEHEEAKRAILMLQEKFPIRAIVGKSIIVVGRSNARVFVSRVGCAAYLQPSVMKDAVMERRNDGHRRSEVWHRNGSMDIAGDEFGIAAFQHMIGGQNGDSARWNDIWNDDDAVESSLGNFLAARVSEEKARRGPP